MSKVYKDKFAKLDIENRLDEIYMLCVDGLTQDELYKYLKVSKSLFYSWMRKGDNKSDEYDVRYEGFYRAVREGNKTSNMSLERTSFKLATGYYEERETTKLHEGIPVTYTERVYVEPKERTLIWLMQNRMPDKYSNRTELDLGGSIETKSVLSGMSEDKFDKLGELLDGFLDSEGEVNGE